MECRKCHSLGHTGSVCHVKVPDVKMDCTWFDDEKINTMHHDHDEEVKKWSKEESAVEEDHIEKFYAS